MSELPVGVVGAGGGRGSMVDLFAAHDNTRIAALCDVDEAGLESAAADWPDAATYTDYGEMLEDVDLELVFVSTPQPLHAEHSVAALRRDINVFSEVGAASTMEGARELVAAAEAADAQYTMGENTRYFRSNVLVERLVEEGFFGDLYYAEGQYLHDLKRITEEVTPWRREDLLGTPGITYPTHQIGPILQWFGDDRIDRITRAGSGSHYTDSAGTLYEADDTSVMLGTTEHGRLVTIRQDIISDRPHAKRFNQYQLQGTGGCFATPSSWAPGEVEEAPDMIWLEAFHGTDDPDHDREFADLMEFEEFLPERYRDPPEEALDAGHFGADYYTVTDFIDAVVADEPAPISVHDAMDMTLPGVVSRTAAGPDDGWVEVPDSRTW